jgi:hypothetical protein
MSSQAIPKDNQDPTSGDPENGLVVQKLTEEERARRMAVLKKGFGIWANRKDIPADGLEYERELRG